MSENNKEIKEKLEKKKLATIFTILTYQDEIYRLERILLLIDIVSVCTPIAFLAVQFSLKSYAHLSDTLECINPVLSVVLIICVMISTIAGYRYKLGQYQRFLGENIQIQYEINEILYSKEPDINDLKQIMNKISILDKEERILITKIADKIKKKNFREALKRIGDVKILCPHCHTSPWEYKRRKFGKSCQLCGNEIKEHKSKEL